MNKIRQMMQIFDIRTKELVGWIITIIAALAGYYFRMTHFHVSEYDQLVNFWEFWVSILAVALFGFYLYYPWLKRSRNR